MNLRVALFAFLFLLGAGGTAAARERLAVIMVVDRDPRLADNLTEVAIARIAEKPGYELVGTRELRARLAQIVQGGDLGECLSRPPCLSEVGTAAGVTRAVIGRVHREPQTFVISLALAETKSALKQAELSRIVPLDVVQLISAVQIGVDELLQHESASGDDKAAAPPSAPAPPVEAPKPQLSPVAPISPEVQPAVSSPEWLREGGRAAPGATTSRVPYVGYGVAALAVASLAAAAVTGSVAIGTPAGSTRADAQHDLDRRKDFATASNGLWVVGGVLGAVSAMAFVWRW